jgi:NAD(P)-dependent dehydrogenase (short-subunit alcohol dehydrogenase family)
MASLLNLEGKHILVLGGGQGMGEATARLLASQGCKVAVVDREADRAELVSGAINDTGGDARPFVIDVLDDKALAVGIATIDREFGPLDGMATVIGMAGWSSLLDMEMATWDADHNRNLRYFFLAAREVARCLMARKAPGSIVCVSSVDGLRSAPMHGAYGAAKAGLTNLARTMAVEWSPHGIRVNVVAAGPMITPRIPLNDETTERQRSQTYPMRRRGTVDEIARAMTFFLSDMSSFVTGQTLAVDGGVLASSPFNIDVLDKPSQGVMGVDNPRGA